MTHSFPTRRSSDLRLGLQLDEAETAEVQSVRQLVEAAQRAGGRPAASSERLAPDQRWIRPGHLGHRLLAAALFLLNRLLMRLLFRLKREGPAGVLPARTLPEERFVIVANHVSDLDPLVMAAALPLATLRRVYWGGDVVPLFGGPPIGRAHV